MKKLLLLLAISSLVACSKKDLNPYRHEVTWRFVLFDSTGRVADSTAELHYPDSALVTLLGKQVISTIPPLAPHDTLHWQMAATFFMIIGPSTVLPGIANIPVPDGGCAFHSNYLYPSLDRTGWMLQRTENGKRINMFAQIQGGNGYDGKFNDFPYEYYVEGMLYPDFAEQDWYNANWICGSTQGSCTMGPDFGY
jgi:hypothetical protein